MTEICPRCGQTIDHENDVDSSYEDLVKERDAGNIVGMWSTIGYVTVYPIEELHRRKHVELDADTTDKLIGFLKLIEHEGIKDE